MSAQRKYYPDPIPAYEPEYTRPADLSWLDRLAKVASEKRQQQRAENKIVIQPAKYVPVTLISAEYSPDAPMPMLHLVRDGFKYSMRHATAYATIADGRARLAYHMRGVEEACQILEDDPSVGSWDIEPLIGRLRGLRRKFRRRERGEE